MQPVEVAAAPADPFVLVPTRASGIVALGRYGAPEA